MDGWSDGTTRTVYRSRVICLHRTYVLETIHYPHPSGFLDQDSSGVRPLPPSANRSGKGTGTPHVVPSGRLGWISTGRVGDNVRPRGVPGEE